MKRPASAIVAAILVLGGCSAASSTPTPTPIVVRLTAAPTVAVTPSPAASPAWTGAWERGVCAAFDDIAAEVTPKGEAYALMKDSEDYAGAKAKFKAAAGWASKAISHLQAAPSWPPGQPFVDNLMTQAVGFRNSDRLMVLSTAAMADSRLVEAVAFAGQAKDLPAYADALKASEDLSTVIRSVFDETGFVCPT